MHLQLKKNFFAFAIFSDIPEENIPVMVYIHGGAYINGSPAEYPGNFQKFFETFSNTFKNFQKIKTKLGHNELVKRGKVIVVSIQYRLGILGFFSRKNGDKIEANFGLYDALTAKLQDSRNSIKF